MKRTRKWAFVEQEAQRLADLGLSAIEIGRRLGITKSTIHRWIQSGKLTRSRPTSAKRSVGVIQTPTAWAKSVRETYQLDVSDDQLVTCGQQALEVAYNMAETPQTRLSAMGRFQAVLKDLALVARLAEDEKPPEKPAPRPMVSRGGMDPRNVLQAVK